MPPPNLAKTLIRLAPSAKPTRLLTALSWLPRIASPILYWSFHNLGDIYLFKMKVMFYILWYAPGWEDLTAQYIGGNALSCYRSAPSGKRCRGDREAA